MQSVLKFLLLQVKNISNKYLWSRVKSFSGENVITSPTTDGELTGMTVLVTFVYGSPSVMSYTMTLTAVGDVPQGVVVNV